LALLIEIGRKSFDVIIAILIMAKTKLPNAAVINNAAVGKDVVAIPIQPGKNIINIQSGGEFGKRL
jgi:hypothetical protein